MLTSTDILRASKAINVNYMFQIAIQYLGLEKNEYDLAVRDAKETLQVHYDCLEKWKLKNGLNATKVDLYNCLEKASKDGLLDRSGLAFLIEEVS